MTVTLPEMPRRIAALKKDERGYPVPWFVAWVNGRPEFRCADPEKLGRAIRERRCWVCGEHTKFQLAFLIGPMCAVNRTTAEPPCHLECAEFSAKACPFLTLPKAQRREGNLPEETQEAAGFAIKRNPGCCLIWVCHDYKLFDDERGGVLFRLPLPDRVLWYAEGRAATRDEVMHSIETGLPILEEMAADTLASQELRRLHRAALALVPEF